MNLRTAQSIANELVESMKHYCERVQIAGSIRRRSPTVKDIEIVAIPKWTERVDSSSLFSEKEDVNELYEWARRRATARAIQWIKPGVDKVIPWTIKPDGKYWRAMLPSGIKLDLFLAQPSNWGLVLAIRTGSWEFSRALVTHAKRIGMPVDKGFIWKDGKPVPTPEEAGVFSVLGLRFIAPENRLSWGSLRMKEGEGENGYYSIRDAS